MGIDKKENEINSKLSGITPLFKNGNYELAKSVLELLNIEYPDEPIITELFSKSCLLTKDIRDKELLYKANRLFTEKNDADGINSTNTIIKLIYENQDTYLSKTTMYRFLQNITFNQNADPFKLIEQNQKLIRLKEIPSLPKLNKKQLTKEFVGLDEIKGHLLPIKNKYYLSDIINNQIRDAISIVDSTQSNVSNMPIIFLSLLNSLMFSIGMRLSNLGLYSEASYLLIQVIRNDNYHINTLIELGEIYRKNNCNESALFILDIAEDVILNHKRKIKFNFISPENQLPAVYYNKSLCYHQKKDYQSAVKFIKNSKELPDGGYFGYLYDGFMNLSTVFLQIQIEQDKFSKLPNPQETDFESFIDITHKVTQKYGQDIKYEVDYYFYYKLSKKGKYIFSTAEYLFHHMKKLNFDFAPVMIEYSKVVEIELYENIFKLFKIWANKYNLNIKTGVGINDFNNFNKITLGGLFHLKKLSQFRQFIETQFNNHSQNYILHSLPEILNNIRKLRNSSAHNNASTYGKVCEIRKILIEEELLAKITQFTK